MSRNVMFCTLCGSCGVLTSYYDKSKMNCPFCGHEMQKKSCENWDEISEEERAALKEKWFQDAKEKGTINEELYNKRILNKKEREEKTKDPDITTENKTSAGKGSLWIGFAKFLGYLSIILTAIGGAIVGGFFNDETGGLIGFIFGLFAGAVIAAVTMLLVTIAENTYILANNTAECYKQYEIRKKDAGFKELPIETKSETKTASRKFSDEEMKSLKEKAEKTGVTIEYLKWKEESTKLEDNL